MAVKRKSARNAAHRYDRHELIRQARLLFGASEDAVAGALSGIGQDELTVEEAKQAIRQFLNGKVS
jgi:hypothetical protein